MLNAEQKLTFSWQGIFFSCFLNFLLAMCATLNLTALYAAALVYSAVMWTRGKSRMKEHGQKCNPAAECHSSSGRTDSAVNEPVNKFGAS